jgi:hypothetical protein
MLDKGLSYGAHSLFYQLPRCQETACATIELAALDWLASSCASLGGELLLRT